MSLWRAASADAGSHLYVGEIPDASDGGWLTLETVASTSEEEVDARWRASVPDPAETAADEDAGDALPLPRDSQQLHSG